MIGWGDGPTHAEHRKKKNDDNNNNNNNDDDDDDDDDNDNAADDIIFIWCRRSRSCVSVKSVKNVKWV